MGKYKIYFEPLGYGDDFPENSTILDCSRQLKIGLVSVCGGVGTCGKCLIRVMDGAVSPVSDAEKSQINEEKLAQGYRLACQTRLLGDCRIYVPPLSLSALQRTQVEGMEITVEPEPAVRTCRVTMSPPSLSDLQSDMERLQMALAGQCQTASITSDFEELRSLPQALRQSNWSVQAVLRDNELIGLLPEAASPLGLAVDLGTTKIAAYLMDLTNGNMLRVKGIMNPQTVYGGDIIARMATVIRSPAEAVKLQDTVVEAINTLARNMCEEIRMDTGAIVDFVVVGNTAMHHLLLRLPVKQLCSAPFIPAVNSALDVKAREIGLKSASGAYVHLLPNIAGYVGADHMAMILSTDLYRKDGVVLALDIGTNTEICLAKHHNLTSLSCASGPAFEGANIKYGMRAAHGAIEHVRLSGNRVEYQTIGDSSAVGICGSGIIDVMALLYRNGIIDSSGKMYQHPKVRENEGTFEFVIASGNGDRPDITFTQKDVRELQLAKGAIGTGIQVLLEANKLKEQDINEIIIAGAFGTYIDINSAIAIGMLPELPPERFRQVGNAAGMGAKMALISRSKRREAQDIAGHIRYIELASYPDFAKIFAGAMDLGTSLRSSE